MSETICTIDVDRWSEPNERRQVRHIGMIKAKDAFDQLYTHLQAKNMLPDEYLLFSQERFENDAELPNYYSAICHTNFGDSEGIYIDIVLQSFDKKNITLATGKTLDESADAFFRMSRIAAECSLMLNGRGRKYTKENVEAVFTPEESLALGETIDEKLCGYLEPDEVALYSNLMNKVYSEENQDNSQETESESEIEP